MHMDQKIAISSEIHVPVYYEDTDFSGYVYHASYLKFMERGREHAFGQECLKALLEKYKLGFVVKSLQIDFLSPAKFADQLTVITRAELSKSPKSVFKQEIVQKSNPEKKVSSAMVDVVTIDELGRPKRLSSEVLNFIKSFSE